MLATGLIDSGAIIAILDRKDEWHRKCSETFAALRMPLATSAAVLSEVFHILGNHAVATVWAFIRSGAVTVLPIGDDDLPELETLMKKYRDRPMDFADATLAHLANRESLTTVFTVDHDDFETYRIGGKRAFRILPERKS